MVPGGMGSSAPAAGVVSGVGRLDAGMGRSVSGEMKRILDLNEHSSSRKNTMRPRPVIQENLLVIQIEQELMVQTFDVFNRGENRLQVLILDLSAPTLSTKSEVDHRRLLPTCRPP